MIIHSNILAWRVPWTEESGGLQSMGLHRVGCNFHFLFFFFFNLKKWGWKSLSHDRLFVTPWTVCSPPGSSAHGILQARLLRRRSQDGGGLGRGDHFLPYKFIQRTTERWANFTKQLLIASWGHQAPRKAAHCLRKEVGQNIKDKKRDEWARDGDPSGKGVLIEEVSKHQETLALAGLGEVFESRRATYLGGEK